MACVPAFCRRDLDVGDPQCPMAHRTNPGFVAPGDAAYYRLFGGAILPVACRFSVLAFPLPQPKQVPRPPNRSRGHAMIPKGPPRNHCVGPILVNKAHDDS